MTRFPMARVSVMIVLLTGIHLHLSRLVFGIDLTLDALSTRHSTARSRVC